MVEIRQLQYFVALSEEGTFVRAAERQHITQSALSQQIARLEREWGVRLFHRGTRGAELTQQGVALLAHTRAVLSGVTGLEALAMSLAREAELQLRVGSPTYAILSSSRRGTVAEFTRRHPDVDLRFTNAWSPRLIEMLKEGDLDLTYAMLAPDEDEIEYLLVEDQPAVVLMPEAHRLARTGTITLGDLAGERVLLYPREINAWAFESMSLALADYGADIAELTETSLPGILDQVRAGLGLVAAVPWETDFINPTELAGLALVPMGENEGLRYRLWLARRRNALTELIASFWKAAPTGRSF